MATTNLSPILEVCKEIMLENKMEMHVNDVARIAVETNRNLNKSEADFAAALSSSLASHVKTKNPLFSKPLNKTGGKKRGVYRLKRTAAQPKTPIQEVATPQVSTLYSGKAGEYLVASELLFHGFNVSMMAVDQGIDLVVEKNGKFHHIQVKTTVADEKALTFSFKIAEKSFKDNAHLSPVYVFVMRHGGQTTFAIFPNNYLQLLRSQGIILGKDLSITITKDPKGKVFKLNSQDVNPFINAFNQIV